LATSPSPQAGALASATRAASRTAGSSAPSDFMKVLLTRPTITTCELGSSVMVLATS
jgi:hypothetical protein